MPKTWELLVELGRGHSATQPGNSRVSVERAALAKMTELGAGCTLAPKTMCTREVEDLRESESQLSLEESPVNAHADRIRGGQVRLF